MDTFTTGEDPAQMQLATKWVLLQLLKTQLKYSKPQNRYFYN